MRGSFACLLLYIILIFGVLFDKKTMKKNHVCSSHAVEVKPSEHFTVRESYESSIRSEIIIGFIYYKMGIK